ncbi:hypothetical protein CAQUA_07565 [Corynebacterium aquatimens]|uniref:Uncharacterized protein n=1 Tax=Corynebacterium aquatimens TaxID=1190508 RepID=A0A931DTN5_9CORY|nr:hypothetical protein [Corynebacterium aquatimens]WJY66209.1 hypothetical protein CAQUA_07565 [Corynebacterium aquatimens]
MVQSKPAKGKDKNCHVTFVAHWRDPRGKSSSKSFPSTKYDQPQKMAVAYEREI